jgi:transposase
LSHKAIHNLIEKFYQGRSKVADNARPGRPVKIVTETSVQWLEQLIRADKKITIDSVATRVFSRFGIQHNA